MRHLYRLAGASDTYTRAALACALFLALIALAAIAKATGGQS